MPRSLDCTQVLDRLEAYVDGDLKKAPAAAFAAHLESCPACAAEHALAADIRSELQAMPAHDAPPAVLREVFRRVGSERFQPRSQRLRARSFRPAWAALAAAAVAAAMLGGGIYLSLGTATQELPPAELAQADPEEIARATEEARLAFAHVARVSRQAGLQVRDDLGEHLVAASTQSLTRALLAPLSPETEAENPEPDTDRS